MDDSVTGHSKASDIGNDLGQLITSIEGIRNNLTLVNFDQEMVSYQEMCMTMRYGGDID